MRTITHGPRFREDGEVDVSSELEALKALLVEKGFVTEADIEAKRRNRPISQKAGKSAK